MRRWGVHKKLGEDTIRAADMTDHNNIPYYVTSCSGYKVAGKKKGGEGAFGGMVFAFPYNLYV